VLKAKAAQLTHRAEALDEERGDEEVVDGGHKQAEIEEYRTRVLLRDPIGGYHLF
jgi:hypothetical protein